MGYTYSFNHPQYQVLPSHWSQRTMYNHSCRVITMIIIVLASNSGPISSLISSVQISSHYLLCHSVFCPAGFVAQLCHYSVFSFCRRFSIKLLKFFTYQYICTDTPCSNNKCGQVWLRVCLGLVFWMEAEAYQPQIAKPSKQWRTTSWNFNVGNTPLDWIQELLE